MQPISKHIVPNAEFGLVHLPIDFYSSYARPDLSTYSTGEYVDAQVRQEVDACAQQEQWRG